MTLFVNKATLEGESHSTMTWGPAQAGVASGVLWAVADGIVPPDLVDDLVLVAAVWVNPDAPTHRSCTTTTGRRRGTRWPPARRGHRRSPRRSSTAIGRSTRYYLPPGVT